MVLCETMFMDPADDHFNKNRHSLSHLVDFRPALDTVRAYRSRSLVDERPPPIVIELPFQDKNPPANLQLSENGRTRCASCASSFHCSPQPGLSFLQEELGYPRPRSTSLRRDQRSCNNSSFLSTVGSDYSNYLTMGNPISPEDPNHPHIRSDAQSTPAVDKEFAAEFDEEGDTSDSVNEDENFLDHRVATVSGYTRDTDGVIYYEIVVESIEHGPLSAYTVRRRYSEFKELHRALAMIMSSKSKHESQTKDVDPSIRSDRTASQSSHSNISQSRLPPLPDGGGLWSYFQYEKPQFLNHRSQCFDAILQAAQQHPQARASRLLNDFLGPPPDSYQTSYVSLNRFAAPTLRISIEMQERKEKAKNISNKRRQLEPMSS